MKDKKIPRDFSAGGVQSHLILILFTCLYIVNYMDRQVLSVVQESIKIELGLNDAQIGSIQTIFLMSIALFALPATYVVDRWSRKKAIGIMALIWSFFTFCTGLGKNYLSLLVPRLFVGIGEGGYGSVGTAMITAAYPNKSRGKVMGIFNMAVPIGSAIGVVLGGYISVKSGNWRTPFYLFAIPGILLGICAFFIKDYKTHMYCDEQGNSIGFIKSIVSLIKIPSLKWLYIGFALMQMVTFSFMVWGPTYIMRCYGCREDKAGMILGIVGMMAIVGAIFGGIVTDRWQKHDPRARFLLPMICSTASAVLLSAAYVLHLQGAGLVLAILYGIIGMMGVPALAAATQEVVPPSLKCMSWGVNVLTQYVLGGGWAPILIGIISDYLGSGIWGLKIALLIATSSGIFASICFWRGSRHYNTDMSKVEGYVLEEA